MWFWKFCWKLHYNLISKHGIDSSNAPSCLVWPFIISQIQFVAFIIVFFLSICSLILFVYQALAWSSIQILFHNCPCENMLLSYVCVIVMSMFRLSLYTYYDVVGFCSHCLWLHTLNANTLFFFNFFCCHLADSLATNLRFT